LLFIILTIILAIAFVISIGFAFVTTGGKIAAGAVIMLWLLIFGICSATTVSARSVGIQTGFGKYQKTLDNGFHWTNPTSSVEEFSTQIQTLYLDGGEGDDDNVVHKSRVNVTYKGGGQGSIAATVSWKISDKEAKALWERYKSFKRVQEQLVQNSAEAAIRDASNKYIPTDAQAKGNDIAALVKTQLASDFSKYGVEVDNVRVTSIGLDEKTQASIEKVVIAQQDLARAELERQKAETEAKTAKIREQSGILSQQANMRYCLDVVNNWDQNKNGQLPAGFNCFGNSDIGVVAPSK
jgi:regulator of protease activity HflC (stomatin/prohibitin superfamily)